MKKWLRTAALLLAFCLAGTASGCGGGKDADTSGASSAKSQSGFDVNIDGETYSGGAGNASGGSVSGGASGASSKKSGGKSSSQVVIKPDDKLPEAPPTDEFPGRVTNLKGRKITVLIWDNAQTGGTGAQTDEAFKALNEKIQKQLNCTLTWMYEIGPDFMTSIAAGNPRADIWGIGDISTFQTAYTNGYLLPLDSLGVIDFGDRSRYTSVTELSVYNNQYYGVGPRTYGALQMAFAQGLMANFSVLKAADAKYTPDYIYGLLGRNEFTWDVFDEISRKVLIANKQPVEDALQGGVIEAAFYQMLVNSNNADWITRQGNSAVFTGGEGGALEALNKYSGWSKDGIIKQVASQNALLSNFVSGKTAFMPIFMHQAITDAQIKAMSDYGFVYMPNGPQLKERKAFTGMASFATIPKNVKNPNEVATVLMHLCTPIFTDAQNRSMARASATNGSKHEKSVNTIMEIYDANAKNGGPLTLWFGIGAGAKIDVTAKEDGWYDLVRKIGNQSLTPTAAIQSAQASYNNKIKKVFTAR